MTRQATGIRQRHGRDCRQTGRRACPWEASVYSIRDGKKIRKQFPTLAAASAWRDDARGAVRRGLHESAHTYDPGGGCRCVARGGARRGDSEQVR